MNIVYQLLENSSRNYQGVLLDEHRTNVCFKGPVRKSLQDYEEQQAILEDLREVVESLSTTGFDTTLALTDILSIETAEVDEKRTWRIGEAIAEVVLAEKFDARFYWNELRDARNPKGNKTGADLVGFVEIDKQVFFLFGEVKTSSQDIRPNPPNVMTGKGEMMDQMRGIYTDEYKRDILIRYLASKTRNLSDSDSFKIDYKNATVQYYRKKKKGFSVVGVLVRDVDPLESDINSCYHKLKADILDHTGLQLIACYIPINKDDWYSIINN
ncbi:hypothetical protein [Spirosoma rhododendri]|uniref:Anti-bacteriophage protein A/HamA C-terminal domain-containing protein n=1 Tax=Spirosoma rhododendri TaxID=2728024 RepID=A0A7L5DKV6_9BACT|nr:hypothetical protein [Spirosoma rhododendri]QJD79066.1 hypothetical protein HH216_12010 [Spirosoma rhododendri]